MKRVLAGLCLVISAFALVGSAHAGDFKGFYVGLEAGSASTNSNARTSTVFSPSGYFAPTSVPAIASTGAQNLSTDGFAGGVDLGYNYQISHLVFGAEFDYGSMHLSDSASNTGVYPCCAPTSFTVTQNFRTRWLFTARPKVGVAWHRVFLYATGGAARTHLNYLEQFSDNFAGAAESAYIRQNVTGWTGGAGLEFRLAHHLSVKGEYLHVDFGSFNTESTGLMAYSPAVAFPTSVFFHTIDLRGNVARVGFNYRF